MVYLLTIYNPKGFDHWVLQRVSAVTFLIVLFIIFFTNNVSLLSLSAFLVTAHISCGIEALVTDYMHDFLAKIYLEATLDILTLSLVKTFFLFYINTF
jgi:succinate dehydrogenase hydrophobic anchor subunit